MIRVDTVDWPWMHYVTVCRWCEDTFGRPADDSWGVDHGYMLRFNEANYMLFQLKWL